MVVDLGWGDFNLDVLSSCPVPQPILSNFPSRIGQAVECPITMSTQVHTNCSTLHGVIK